MNKTTYKKQNLFDLHLEYTEKASLKEKEYRELEGKFALAFGFLPLKVDDTTFPYLEENKQDACRAFWNNVKVATARKELFSARMLAEAYFNGHCDLQNRS